MSKVTSIGKKLESLSYPTISKAMALEIKMLINSLTPENQYEYLAKTIIPLWNMTYREQLKRKQKRCREIIDKIVSVSGNSKNLMTYTLLGIVPSPVIKAYRNRDEFPIARGVDGNPKTVGCIIGSHTLKKMVAVHPTKIDVIKKSHKKVAQVYEDFIRLSPVPASVDPFDYGHWSTLVVRSNEAGDVMASVSVKPRGYTMDNIDIHRQALKEYFSKHLPRISLYHQVCPFKRCTEDVAPFNLLYGRKYIFETLKGYRFEISPDRGFPSNKMGAEVMYNAIVRTAQLKPKTTVLDICSGSGTNSIVLSKFVKQVIGLEYLKKKVLEAQNTAQHNNISNVKFKLGSINEILKSALDDRNLTSDVVGILTHRFTGLGLDVVKTIRRSSQISRLVFISYYPQSRKAVQNLVDLCSDNNSYVPPFRLSKVVPIDLAPHTLNVEFLLFFQRKPVRND